MSINSITSFKGQDFNSLIAEPPSSCAAPIAAHSIEPDTYEKSSGSTGKVIASSLIGLGILATGLGLLRGKVKAFQEIDLTKGTDNLKFWDKTKYYVAKAGEFINENASKAWNKVKGWFGKGKNAANEATGTTKTTTDASKVAGAEATGAKATGAKTKETTKDGAQSA